MTTPDTGSHVGTDQHERDTANRHDHGTNGAGAGRDVTSRTTPDDHTTSSSTQHTWTTDRGDRVSVHNTVNGNADGLIQTAVVYGNVDFTAGQGGDVTTDAGRATGRGRATADDAAHDTRTTGSTLRNTNIAHPGAHVGSQHDIHHGTTHVSDDHHTDAPGDTRDVTDDFRETLRSAGETLRHVTRHTNRRDHDRDDEDRDDHRTTRNAASGNDHVTQQVGFTLADLRRLRRR